MQHTAHTPYPARLLALCTMGATLLLAGCDYLGIESAGQMAGQKAAEGKATGAACRQANRALEDCYRYNPKAHRAAVFDGWKDMDLYMRENKLETITPVTPPEPPKKPVPKKDDDEAVVDTKSEAKSDKKADTKPAKGGH